MISDDSLEMNCHRKNGPRDGHGKTNPSQHSEGLSGPAKLTKFVSAGDVICLTALMQQALLGDIVLIGIYQRYKAPWVAWVTPGGELP